MIPREDMSAPFSSRSKWGMGLLAAGGALLFYESWFRQKYYFEEKRFVIGDPRSRERLSIVLLTDLHIQRRLWPWYRRLARRIYDIRPDLLLISGDLLDESGLLPPLENFMRLLPPNLPKICIPGNHDHAARPSIEALGRMLQRYRGQLLVNQTTGLTLRGHSICITGLNDFIEGEASLSEAVTGIGRERHHLGLVHSPLQAEAVRTQLQQINAGRAPEDRLDIRYLFSGHNHGGQVRLGPLVPVLPKFSGPYLDGWYFDDSPQLYVSRGFGTSRVPFRFGARSELTVFDYGL